MVTNSGEGSDLLLLIVAGPGLIVEGLAVENINLSLHRLGAIFGLDCLNTAMILLGAALLRPVRGLGAITLVADNKAMSFPARVC
jgi:hypothetical protein